MKKQLLLTCFTLLFSAAALVWANSYNKKEEAAAPAHTCAKSCKAESKQAISTGFFIVDSFSGIL